MPDRIGKETTSDVRRYRRQEKAKLCLQQFQFGAKGEIKENPHRFAHIEEKGIDPYKDVTCPFCLGLSKLRLWLLSTKKGYDRGKGRCPECGHNAQFRTLYTQLSSPEQYANFAYPYAKSGFWTKIKEHPNNKGADKFPEWKKRLALMGWTERFWNEYKRLRGDPEKEEEEKRISEGYAAYEAAEDEFERKQREESVEA